MINKTTISKSIAVFALFIGVLGMSTQSASADWMTQIFGRSTNSRPSWAPQDGAIIQNGGGYYGSSFTNGYTNTGSCGLFTACGGSNYDYGNNYGNGNYNQSQCYDCGTYAGNYIPSQGSNYNYGYDLNYGYDNRYGSNYGNGYNDVGSWLSNLFGGNGNNYGYSNGYNTYDNNYGYSNNGYDNGYYDDYNGQNGAYYGDDVYYDYNRGW